MKIEVSFAIYSASIHCSAALLVVQKFRLILQRNLQFLEFSLSLAFPPQRKILEMPIYDYKLPLVRILVSLITKSFS